MKIKLDNPVHRHLGQEESCNIKEGHVIIDAALYWELVAKFGEHFFVTK